MKCPECDGTGDSSYPGDSGCDYCDGVGLLCDVCGVPCDDDVCPGCEEWDEEEDDDV